MICSKSRPTASDLGAVCFLARMREEDPQCRLPPTSYAHTTLQLSPAQPNGICMCFGQAHRRRTQPIKEGRPLDRVWWISRNRSRGAAPKEESAASHHCRPPQPLAGQLAASVWKSSFRTKRSSRVPSSCHPSGRGFRCRRHPLRARRRFRRRRRPQASGPGCPAPKGCDDSPAADRESTPR